MTGMSAGMNRLVRYYPHRLYREVCYIHFASTFSYAIYAGSSESTLSPRPTPATKSVVKSSAKKVSKVSKISKTGDSAVKRDVSSALAIIERGTKFPNMSRKPKLALLYVFPSFDKCDSLLYFPSSMSRHLNSGDFPSLTKLFNAHVRKSCDIDFACCTLKPQPNDLVRLFEYMDQLHPDSIMCCHATKVIENEIHASMYMKFTDCKAIYDSLSSTIKDPFFQSMFSEDRSTCLKEKMNLDARPEAERQLICAVVDSDKDFVVYLKINLVMTIDDMSKKAVAMKFTSELTSVSAVGFAY